MSNKSVLEEAQELLHGARMEEYGPPRESFERIARMWSIVLDTEVSAEQVALCMLQMKVSRAMQGYHRDSFVDIAGYAGTLEMLQEDVVEIPVSRSPQARISYPDYVRNWAAEAQAMDTQ